MFSFETIALLDGLEYVSDRTEADALFQTEMAKLGISEFWHAPNMPYQSLNPFSREQADFKIIGRHVEPLFDSLNDELDPMIQKGNADPQIEHFRHSVRPLMLSIDQSFDHPMLKKASEITRDHEVFGVIGFPCHHGSNEYGMYALYALRDQSDLFSDMCRNVQALHFAAICFDSFCNLKLAPTNYEAQLSLAPRERECLLWVAAGFSSKRIAYKLGISLHTVNEFIGNAMRKLQATTRAEAAAKAISAKIINP